MNVLYNVNRAVSSKNCSEAEREKEKMIISAIEIMFQQNDK